MSRTQNRFGDRLLMALVFLFLYAPIIILIVFSFGFTVTWTLYVSSSGVSYSPIRASFFNFVMASQPLLTNSR